MYIEYSAYNDMAAEYNIMRKIDIDTASDVVELFATDTIQVVVVVVVYVSVRVQQALDTTISSYNRHTGYTTAIDKLKP